MLQDNLGLFDTPPSRKQVRFSFAIIGLLFAVLVLTSAVRDVRLGQVNAFIPMIDATTALIDLITATLLYVQATVFRSRALNVLASGYVFTALILIPHALTFPGAFAPDGLLGAGVSTTAWLYIFWRASVPIAVDPLCRLLSGGRIGPAGHGTARCRHRCRTGCNGDPGSSAYIAGNERTRPAPVALSQSF